jgi:hypothetical protein
VACDLVGCRCPRLQGCPTKHDCAQTGKALPAIPLGTAAHIGSVGTQRLAIPCRRVCPEATEAGEAALQRRLLQQVQMLLAPDEALVTDRGFPLAQRHEAGIRYISRGPTNFTARRACHPRTAARATDRREAPWSVRCREPTRAARLRLPHPTGVRRGRPPEAPCLVWA